MDENSTADRQLVRTLFRRYLIVAILVGLVLSNEGCSRNKYLGVRKVPKNPLAGPLNLLSRQGPRPTKRTIQTLRRLDLEEQLESDRRKIEAYGKEIEAQRHRREMVRQAAAILESRHRHLAEAEAQVARDQATAEHLRRELVEARRNLEQEADAIRR